MFKAIPRTAKRSSANKVLFCLMVLGEAAKEIYTREEQQDDQLLSNQTVLEQPSDIMLVNQPTTDSPANSVKNKIVVEQTNNIVPVTQPTTSSPGNPNKGQSKKVETNHTLKFGYDPFNINGEFKFSNSELKNLLLKVKDFLLSLIDWAKQETFNLLANHPIKALLAAATGAFLGFYYLGSGKLIVNLVAPALEYLGVSHTTAVSIGSTILGTTSAIALLDLTVKIGEEFVSYMKNEEINAKTLKSDNAANVHPASNLSSLVNGDTQKIVENFFGNKIEKNQLGSPKLQRL